MSMQFYSILIYLLTQLQGEPIEREKEWGRLGGGSTISEKWGNHIPCQPTIAAQLLGNGGKIEPYTILIMDQPVSGYFLECFFTRIVTFKFRKFPFFL
jgi:hypothetical protein